jgi:hypothetical protein
VVIPPPHLRQTERIGIPSCWYAEAVVVVHLVITPGNFCLRDLGLGSGWSSGLTGGFQALYLRTAERDSLRRPPKRGPPVENCLNGCLTSVSGGVIRRTYGLFGGLAESGCPANSRL